MFNERIGAFNRVARLEINEVIIDNYLSDDNDKETKSSLYVS